MDRSRSVQVPTDPPQPCPTCGETMVLLGGEFLPMGRKDWVRQIDPRPVCVSRRDSRHTGMLLGDE